MMDKIKKKWPDNVELRNKVNELIEENTEMMRILDTMVWKVFGVNDKEMEKREDG